MRPNYFGKLTKIKTIALSLGLLVLPLTGFAAPVEQENPDQKQIEELEGKIQTLQWELNALQKKLDQVKSQPKKQAVTKENKTPEKLTPSIKNNSTQEEQSSTMPSGSYKYWNPNAKPGIAANPKPFPGTAEPKKNPSHEPSKKTESEPQTKTTTKSNSQNYNVLVGVEKEIEKNFPIDGFKKVLINADLGDMIKYDKEGFTVFVPTDESMVNDLSSDRVVELLGKKDAARYFTMFHMIKDQMTMNQLKALNGKELDSVSNTTLTFTVSTNEDGEQMIVNGARIVGGPYKGNNVTIYIVDTVITP